jgi:molecular chaperone IbpA
MLLKEDMAMRYDFSPLYRSTVGFDRMFDLLDRAAPDAGWPPYDIEKLGDDQFRITLAVAGFTPEDIELVQDANTLTVSGQKQKVDENAQYTHRGIATRSFRQRFSLADHVKVTNAALENGLLTVELRQEIPEALKPRRIEIGSGKASADIGQDNRRQIEAEAKAA